MKLRLYTLALCLVLLFAGSGIAQQDLSRWPVHTLQSAAAATGNGTALETTPMSAVSVQVTGTFSATITFEGTVDGSNWIALMATNANDDSRATTATAAGIYSVVLNGCTQFRARISTYASGNVTVKARLGNGLIARSSGGGGAPSGAAGGSLDGTYPNPGIAASVAGSGLSESTNVLAVNVDDSTIEISTDTLRVKDAGVTNAKLAGSIAAAKLIGSDIATVGTITAGVWNGTAVGAQYGGTGLNTSASTGYPSLSAGTWSIVNAATLTAALDAVVGDSGSGGTKGLVPAPSAGDAAASKFLKADGTWAAASGGLTVGSTAIGSGTTTRVLYNNGGTLGEYPVTGSTNVVMSASPTLTGTVAMAAMTASGAITQTSASATAFESGPNGGTNPVFRLVNNVSSAATGLSITGNAATAGVTLTALSSGSNENINLVPKGTSGFINFPGNGASPPGYHQYSTGLYLHGTTTGTGVMWGNNLGGGFPMAFIVYRTNSLIGTNSGGVFGWTSAWFSENLDLGMNRHAAGVMRLNSGTTNTATNAAAGSLLIGTSAGAIGSSGAGVLAFALSTAPSSSPTDTVQMYSNDAAAGDHNLYTRNEGGEINRLTGLAARVATQFDKTSNTTLGDVTGLTRNVEAGRTYAFTAVLYTTSNTSGGVKAAIAGTATATSIIYEAQTVDGSTVATVGTARATALGTAVGDVTAVAAAKITITGTIVVNAAGTLTVQFAQNASNGTASSVLVNSSFNLIPIS